MRKDLRGAFEDWGLRIDEPSGPINLAPGHTADFTHPLYVVKVRVLTKEQAAAEAVEERRRRADREAEALRERQAFNDAVG